MCDFADISPYAEGNLGRACNDAIRYAPTDWVCLRDADTMPLHPNWRALCAAAIERFPDAGLFTCWTSAIWRARNSPEPLVPDSAPAVLQSMGAHLECARRIWDRYRFSVTELTDVRVGLFFHLTNRKAWTQSGGYPGQGMFDEDHGYCRALSNAGLKVYRIDGLYVYHLGSKRGHREHSWIAGERTVTDYRERKVEGAPWA